MKAAIKRVSDVDPRLQAAALASACSALARETTAIRSARVKAPATSVDTAVAAMVVAYHEAATTCSKGQSVLFAHKWRDAKGSIQGVARALGAFGLKP